MSGSARAFPAGATFALLLALVLSAGPGRAQSLLSTSQGPSLPMVLDIGPLNAAVTPNSADAEPPTPPRGWDASINYSANHDSSAGWSNMVSPSFAYRFNRIFSADASLPVYLTLNGCKAGVKPKNGKVPKLKSLNDELGDAVLSTHVELHPRLLDYTATASLTAPTGDTTYGLSPGRVTWNENNHFERSAAAFTPDVELGIGDNAALSNRRIARNYTTLGTLAYFQAGTSVDLPMHVAFDLEGYEQLPIGSQKVYTTILRKKKTIQRLTASGDAEDNGINATLDHPLGRHFSASAYYSRSVRLGLDTAGIGLNYHFRGPPAPAAAYQEDLWSKDHMNVIY